MSETASPRGPVRRGRPPLPDDPILEAVLRLLARDGYSRMSMDGVAAEAGVSKPTLYARYRGKADLVTAALGHLRETTAAPPSGDVRADLATHLEQARVNAEASGAMGLIGTCLAEEHHVPELIALLRERTIGPRRDTSRRLILDAIERGEISPDTDVEAVVILLGGAIHGQYLSGEPFPLDWAQRAVEAALPRPPA